MKETAATFFSGAEVPASMALWLYGYIIPLGLPKRRRFVECVAVTGMDYGTLFWPVVQVQGFFPDLSLSSSNSNHYGRRPL